MLQRIQHEITADPYYSQNYANQGECFIAWYLRRILLLSPTEARQAVTDGADDKQIDAVVVDEEHQRILIIQGKFIGDSQVGAEPLREVLGAWTQLLLAARLQ